MKQKCPECGKWFNTIKGLRVHFSKCHKKFSISNNVCRNCGSFIPSSQEFSRVPEEKKEKEDRNSKKSVDLNNFFNSN